MAKYRFYAKLPKLRVLIYKHAGGEPGVLARPPFCWTGEDVRRSTV